ncbi:MAG: ABC transporter ATP-binding protein [Promethearchaeota archaeon]|jgi:ABC-2 type transport system ATP-binding protein
MSDNIIVKVVGLKKFFGDVKAVNGISFDINKGEVFGLLGPNGAGKTTTIKLLLGLLEPNEGNMSVFGLNPERNEVEIKRRIGYVSEEPLIFKSLTPKDLFNFIASVRNLDENTVTDAAILHEPDLLILDEPIAGLDAKSVRVVKTILELHTQRGGSVLFSTHIMEIAQDLCNRIGIINKGKIVGIGTIEELRLQADKVGASLEDVFLRLTEQDTSVNEIVKKLRASFKMKN